MTEARTPYASLVPLLELLEANGNVAVDGGFLNSPAGWYCRLRDPIDFELLRRGATVSRTIDLLENDDTVLDRSTWSALLGPRADGY